MARMDAQSQDEFGTLPKHSKSRAEGPPCGQVSESL